MGETRMAMRRNQFVSSGMRDRLVTIQQRPSADAAATSGFPTETWTALGTAWMEKVDVSGLERFRSEQLSAKYDTRWRMAYRVDMDPDVVTVPKLRQLVHRGRTYDVVAAEVIGHREGIELTTLAGGTVSS